MYLPQKKGCVNGPGDHCKTGDTFPILTFLVELDNNFRMNFSPFFLIFSRLQGDSSSELSFGFGSIDKFPKRTHRTGPNLTKWPTKIKHGRFLLGIFKSGSNMLKISNFKKILRDISWCWQKSDVKIKNRFVPSEKIAGALTNAPISWKFRNPSTGWPRLC